MRDLCFVDVETTGLDLKSRLTEIALYRTSAKEMFHNIDIFTCKILPPLACHIEPRALEINGYDREVWKLEGAKSFEEEEPTIREYLNDTILVGWNVKFDIGMMSEEYMRVSTRRMPWHYHSFDVMNFMMPLYFAGRIHSLSLHAACEHFAISNLGEHGAEIDVMRTLQVLEALNEHYKFFQDDQR